MKKAERIKQLELSEEAALRLITIAWDSASLVWRDHAERWMADYFSTKSLHLNGTVWKPNQTTNQGATNE